MDELAELGSRLEGARAQVASMQQELADVRGEQARMKAEMERMSKHAAFGTVSLAKSAMGKRPVLKKGK